MKNLFGGLACLLKTFNGTPAIILGRSLEAKNICKVGFSCEFFFCYYWFVFLPISSCCIKTSVSVNLSSFKIFMTVLPFFLSTLSLAVSCLVLIRWDLIGFICLSAIANRVLEKSSVFELILRGTCV